MCEISMEEMCVQAAHSLDVCWAQAVHLSADVFLCMLTQCTINQDFGLKYLY